MLLLSPTLTFVREVVSDVVLPAANSFTESHKKSPLDFRLNLDIARARMYFAVSAPFRLEDEHDVLADGLVGVVSV